MKRRPMPLVIVFSLMGVLIVGLPFIFMSLPNPQPIPVSSLSEGGSGTYVGLEPELMKVFPRGGLQESTPPDAPTVRSDARVFVKARAVSALDTYTLADAESGRLVDVDRVMLSSDTLELRPREALNSGVYVATVPRADPYGASDYYYFVVR